MYKGREGNGGCLNALHKERAMNENPSKPPERLPSEPDPPELTEQRQTKTKKNVKWSLSGFFNLRKLKGGFKGKRQVTIEKFFDD